MVCIIRFKIIENKTAQKDVAYKPVGLYYVIRIYIWQFAPTWLNSESINVNKARKNLNNENAIQ